MMFAADMARVDLISEIIGGAIVIGVIVFLIWLRKRSRTMEKKQAEMTQPETVHAYVGALNKREALGKREYFVHFLTDDGREIRLSVTREAYKALKKTELCFDDPRRVTYTRQSGMLTYQGIDLISFENDPEQY